MIRLIGTTLIYWYIMCMQLIHDDHMHCTNPKASTYFKKKYVPINACSSLPEENGVTIPRLLLLPVVRIATHMHMMLCKMQDIRHYDMHMYSHTRTCTHTHTHAHTRTRVHTHTHTHTSSHVIQWEYILCLNWFLTEVLISL